jgi:cytochrome c-type biogenesis protein CcmH/NrfG
LDAALPHYREAVRLRPEAHPYLNDLAWALATAPQDDLRNGPEAVELAEAACRLSPQEPRYLGTLDAALAEAGRFPEAIAAAEKARALAEAQNQPDIASQAGLRLALYREGKPYRLAPSR